MLKTVQKFGNSSHIVLPKEYLGKQIKLLIEKKTLNTIKKEILDILNPYLEHIMGIYLYGSYARNEQTNYSDIDILIITDKKIKIKNKNEYSILSITKEQVKDSLEKNAILILPFIKEAKPILNQELINKYKNQNFNKKNLKWFIDTTESILKVNKEYLDLDLGIGGLIYSLILRTRGLLLIKHINKNKLLYNKDLIKYLQKSFSKEVTKEIYTIYLKEKNKKKIEKSNIITKKDLQKLLLITKQLLNEIKKEN